MQRWLLMVEMNCEPSREAEYEAWWQEVHVHDVLASPGYRRGRFFRIREPRDGRGRYLILWDVETADIERTMRERTERRDKEHAGGRHPAGLMYPVWRNLAWRETFSLLAPQNSAGAGCWLNLVEQNCDPKREAQYHAWYNETHIPDALKTPAFVSARRYEAREPRDGRGRFLAAYEIETDDMEATMKVRLQKRDEEVKAGRGSASLNNLTRPVWRDVMWQLAAEVKT